MSGTTAAPSASPERGTGVLVVGSVSADLTTFSDRLPAPGETLIGDAFTLVLGGKGANQVLAAGLAGGNAIFVACVGDDLFSDMVRGSLADGGVDISHVRTVPGPTGIAHIRVDGRGENDIVIVPLANTALSTEQIDAAFDAVGEACPVLLTQLEIPRELAVHAIRRAASEGKITVLDPAPAAALPDDLWPHVSIVTPNETEAAILTGIEVTDLESATRAGHWFLDHGVTTAIITLASEGAVVVTADGVSVYPPFAVDAIDTTAAGDSFAGYLGASLAAGDDLPVAMRRANAAGALAVTRRGASPSLPSRAEVEAFLAERPES